MVCYLFKLFLYMQVDQEACIRHCSKDGYAFAIKQQDGSCGCSHSTQHDVCEPGEEKYTTSEYLVKSMNEK